MKYLPWNRFTKHLCVFLILAIILAAYYWRRECLIALVALMLPVVHRIERDYRSKRQKCPRCRRYKCRDEMDVTFCGACAAAERQIKSQAQALLLPGRRVGDRYRPAEDHADHLVKV